MADTINHRGPDDRGYYLSGPLGLGFCRLSIIDLDTGHQPLCNEDGTVWIVFNGEIYNYAELRQRLLSSGHHFRTKTDTEVIVHLYEELGESCLQHLRGMFGLAIWDARKHKLFLARDRLGIKPLYYRLSDDSVIFGSEIKAILADPGVDAEVLPWVIDRFLTFYYLPGEETLFRGIRKLPPGSYAVIADGKLQVKQYWDLRVPQASYTLAQAEEELVSLLDESLRLHMISDVPVGLLLSGGVDSTAMLSFSVGKSDWPLSTFTLGFSSPGLADERPYAKLAAERCNSQHHDLTISAKDFADFMPNYVWHMEEPICEPPGVNLYYVSKLSKDFVKVLISGEGGDEAFGGYQNYRSMLWLERLKTGSSLLDRKIAASLGAINKVIGSSRITKYGPLFAKSFDSYYYSRTSTPHFYFNAQAQEIYSDEFYRVVDKQRSLSVVHELLERSDDSDLVNKMLYVDTKTWLPDDLLVKADKMTMANSIELRVPLLDHKVMEFAASLPGNYKVRGLATKYLFKKCLRKRVPRAILNRRKTGFVLPYADWLRTELQDWLSDILLDRETLARGYFRRNAIEQLLKADRRRGGYSKELFSLAVLELWHREFLKKPPRTGIKREEVAAVPCCARVAAVS